LTFKTLIMGEHGITLFAAMTAPKAACPDCHLLASRIHSDYPRTLADLPWATMPIRLRLTVRRFFCTTCTCGRQTFTKKRREASSFTAGMDRRWARRAQCPSGQHLPLPLWSPQWAMEWRRWKPRHSCRGGRPSKVGKSHFHVTLLVNSKTLW
jgi:transposase